MFLSFSGENVPSNHAIPYSQSIESISPDFTKVTNTAPTRSARSGTCLCSEEDHEDRHIAQDLQDIEDDARSPRMDQLPGSPKHIGCLQDCTGPKIPRGPPFEDSSGRASKKDFLLVATKAFKRPRLSKQGSNRLQVSFQ